MEDMQLLRADSDNGLEYRVVGPKARGPGFAVRAVNRIGAAVSDLVSVFSPARAAQMQMARKLYMSMRGFDAYDYSRLNFNRQPQHVRDADSEINGKLNRMRSLQRDQIRNNGIARSIKKTLRNNVVGDADVGLGLTVDAAATLPGSDQPDVETNKILNREWRRLKDSLDISGRWKFVELCGLSVQEIIEAGEVLAVMHDRPAPGSDIPFCVELLEADRLPTNNEAFMPRNPYGDVLIEVPVGVDKKTGAMVYKTIKRFVKHGIEYDENKAICAYHILKYHPGNQYNLGAVLKTERVLAERVIHYFDADRAEQTRGISDLVAALPRLADIDDAFTFELMACKSQACIGLHVKNGTIGNVPFPNGNNGGSITDANGNPVTQLQPGMITQGGADVQMITNNRPGNNFLAFLKSLTRVACCAVGMSYEAVCKDFTGTNFSGLRQGALEDRRGYRSHQGLLIRYFVHRIWNRFVRACAIAGKIDITKYRQDPSRYRCHVVLPGWEYVNPLQEIQAEVISLENGLKSMDEVANPTGKTVDERLRKLAQQKELSESLDLNLSCLHGEDAAKKTVTNPDQDGQEKIEELGAKPGVDEEQLAAAVAQSEASDA